MAVYVDPLFNYGWHLGPSCHMFADSLDELHVMAEGIGMKRAWFQNKPGFPHYDLVKSRRDRAVANGAVQHSRAEAVAKWRALASPASRPGPPDRNSNGR
jgi:hypothetical protein